MCSPDLVRSRGQSREVHLVPNAVDVKDHERISPRPADLPARPVAVYVGTLHRYRLDVDLCEQVGLRLGTQASLVLVGPDALERPDTSRLEAAGVKILGARPKQDVPAYLRHADVLVVPHVVSPFTESLDPIKAYEYAAARRPVASTPVAGFRSNDEVTIAEDETFVDEVVRQVRPRRADILGGHAPDWSVRVESVAQVLARVGN